MKKQVFVGIALAMAVAAIGMTGAAAQAANSSNVYITEWMYKPAGTATLGEFAEITNTGTTAVDMTGWSFDDSHRIAGTTDLSSIGTLASGESAIITDDTAADFRSIWSLSASVPVIGDNTANLGNGDEINIYDASQTLVDELTYDNGTVDPKTSGVSGNIPFADLGTNDAKDAVLSFVGDTYGSTTSTQGDIGNPGFYPVPTVTTPEPASLGVLALGGLALLARRRK